jgi:hypothetical protein
VRYLFAYAYGLSSLLYYSISTGGGGLTDSILEGRSELAWLGLRYVAAYWVPIAAGVGLFALARPVAAWSCDPGAGEPERSHPMHRARNFEIWIRVTGAALAATALGAGFGTGARRLAYGGANLDVFLLTYLAVCLLGAIAGAVLFAYVPRPFRFDARREEVREGLLSGARGVSHGQTSPTLRETLAAALKGVGVYASAGALAGFAFGVSWQMAISLFARNPWTPAPPASVAAALTELLRVAVANGLASAVPLAAGLALVFLGGVAARLIYRGDPPLARRLLGPGKHDLWIRVAAIPLMILGFQVASIGLTSLITPQPFTGALVYAVTPLVGGAILGGSGLVGFVLAPRFAGRQRDEVRAVQVDAQ